MKNLSLHLKREGDPRFTILNAYGGIDELNSMLEHHREIGGFSEYKIQNSTLKDVESIQLTFSYPILPNNFYHSSGLRIDLPNPDTELSVVLKAGGLPILLEECEALRTYRDSRRYGPLIRLNETPLLPPTLVPQSLVDSILAYDWDKEFIRATSEKMGLEELREVTKRVLKKLFGKI